MAANPDTVKTAAKTAADAAALTAANVAAAADAAALTAANAAAAADAAALTPDIPIKTVFNVKNIMSYDLNLTKGQIHPGDTGIATAAEVSSLHQYLEVM